MRGRTGALLPSLRLVEEPVDEQLRGGDVRRERDVFHVADPQERGDIGLVSLCGERIAEEDDAVDRSVGDLRADLQVAAERSGGLVGSPPVPSRRRCVSPSFRW